LSLFSGNFSLLILAKTLVGVCSFFSFLSSYPLLFCFLGRQILLVVDTKIFLHLLLHACSLLLILSCMLSSHIVRLLGRIGEVTTREIG
jgi:hypothetical protein